MVYNSSRRITWKTKEHLVYNLCNVHRILASFLQCNVLHSVKNMYWWTFLRGLFLLLLPANYTVAKEYLIPLYKEHRKHRTFNTETPSVTSNQIEKMKNKAQFLEQKILFHVNINRKITCKIVWKMQCLKNEIQFIRRLSKSQLTLFPPMYFDLVVTDIRWGLNYPHHTFFWIENCYWLTWNLV